MQRNRERLGQGGINEAAARIRHLLEQEEQDQQLEQVMVDRLRASGWQPNLPPAPAAGPSLADAAQAIEAQLNQEDAYRAEAQRRLAAKAARGSAVQQMVNGSDVAAQGDDGEPTADWPTMARDIAGRLGLDPDQIIAAGPDILPTLRSIEGYRHLDRQGQYEVMQEIERWQQSHPQLHSAMRAKIADIVANHRWEPSSMSTEELKAAVSQNNKLINGIGWGTLAVDIGGSGIIPKIPSLGGWPIAGFSAAAVGAQMAIEAETDKFREELCRRGETNYCPED